VYIITEIWFYNIVVVSDVGTMQKPSTSDNGRFQKFVDIGKQKPLNIRWLIINMSTCLALQDFTKRYICTNRWPVTIYVITKLFPSLRYIWSCFDLYIIVLYIQYWCIDGKYRIYVARLKYRRKTSLMLCLGERRAWCCV
jgi:hypothetical protein